MGSHTAARTMESNRNVLAWRVAATAALIVVAMARICSTQASVEQHACVLFHTNFLPARAHCAAVGAHSFASLASFIA